MLRELTDYFRPTEIAEALALLARLGNVVALAGGTELLSRKDATIGTVVDLQGLGLDYLRRGDDGLHIGAMTRLQTLALDSAARLTLGDSIARSVVHSATYTERSAATVGGTIAAAQAWHDLLPAFLVVEAMVTLQSAAGKAIVAIDALLSNRDEMLPKGTLITEVLIPIQPEGAHFGCQRVSRTPADRAIVNLAVRLVLREGIAREVRIGAGGVAEYALRLTDAEMSLKDNDIGRSETRVNAAAQAMRSIDPPSDHIASGEYRRAMVGVLLQRTLSEVAERHA